MGSVEAEGNCYLIVVIFEFGFNRRISCTINISSKKRHISSFMLIIYSFFFFFMYIDLQNVLSN